MANGISKNPLTDISNVYLNQIAEGSLKNLEKASVLAMSDKPEDQDKAREIKTRFDYQSLMKQKRQRKQKLQRHVLIGELIFVRLLLLMKHLMNQK